MRKKNSEEKIRTGVSTPVFHLNNDLSKKSFKYFLNKIFFKSHFEFKKITILLKNITFFLAVKLILNDDVLKKKI